MHMVSGACHWHVLTHLYHFCALKTEHLMIPVQQSTGWYLNRAGQSETTPPFPLFTFFSLFLATLARHSLGKVDFEPIPLRGRSIERYITVSPWRHLNQLIYNRIASVGPFKGPVSLWPALGQRRCGYIGLSLPLLPIDSHDTLLMRKDAYDFSRNRSTWEITGFSPW